jgi:thioredoxin reductase
MSRDRPRDHGAGASRDDSDDAAEGASVVSRHTLILGAGPGGLQLAYFLQKSGSDYLVLEEAEGVGDFFRRMPRGRKLISFNKRNSIYEDPEVRLRWDWNSLLTDDYGQPFREVSKALYPDADDLVRYLEAFAEAGQLAIRTKTRVARVARTDDGGFELTDTAGNRFRCRVLVVATGFSRPYVPDIPGISLCEDYETVSQDPDDFEGQRVLILGKGNSALETADVMLDTAALIHVASPTPVRLAWQTRHPGDLRAHHTRLMDMYQLKTLNGALDCHVQDIRREDDGRFVVTVDYVHADGEVEELVYDRVIRCTGFRVDRSIYADDCLPDTVHDGRLPAIKGLWESANVPDLFFAGTLMQGLDFKRSSSAFIDGFRYNVRTLHRHLLERYEGKSAPVIRLAASAEALRRHVIERACRTSALWTQFGYLCDLILVDPESGEATVQEELPVHHVEGLVADHDHAYTLTFEWGPWDGDVFQIERHPRHDTAHTNVFLHPIVRRWRRGELVAEHHVLEDLFGTYAAAGERGAVRRRSGRDMETYHREEHEQPMEAFFAAQLAG